MISSKYLSKIALSLILFAVILCVLSIVFYDVLSYKMGITGYASEYEEKLFNKEVVLDIDIKIDEESWNKLLNEATKEEYYECDVLIGDKAFYNVGIRAKGNTSLSSIARDPDNNRYSFKLEFDHFVKNQTCFGLDKLVLNNSYADTSNMKEAIIYDMYEFLDVPASLYNYAKIMVNGEYFGAYLALEAVEDSFMLRSFGAKKGALYKPESMGMGGGFGRGGGANLNYTDDSLQSYSAIWNGAVTESDDADHQRVVTALKNINQGTDISKYLDVDNTLKYMAVHNFSVNKDSLSGSMAHNYYLYESGGKLAVLPWDYNLAFGGMGGNNATSVINEPIDEPFNATRFFNCLFENEEYLNKYHEYYNRLIDEYFNQGEFDKVYKSIRNKIDALIETDPTFMYTYDEYLKGTEALYELISLRKESIKGQLDGTIGSTKAKQNENPEALVDGSHINLSSLGRFMGGGGFGMNNRR